MNLTSLKESLSRLTEEHSQKETAQLHPKLLGQITYNYRHKLIAQLNEIFSKLDEAAILAELSELLSQNWGVVKGTILCYTALPKNTLTIFLCDAAAYIAEHYGDKTKKAISYLMPDVVTESLSDDYPDLEDLPLQHIILTHIVSSDKSYLIPIRLICKHPVGETFYHNFYYNFKKHPEEKVWLDQEEVTRLYQHSLQAQELAELKKNAVELRKKDQSLFSYIERLITALHSNDSHGGNGQNERAGETAYSAITSFFCYYDSIQGDKNSAISLKIREEIELLRSVGGEKSNIGNIKSCIGTRQEQLKGLLNKHGSKLKEIRITENGSEKLLAETEKDYAQAQESLDKQLNQNTYIGEDILPITFNILNYLGIALSFENFDNALLLLDMSPASLNSILSQEPIKKSLVCCIAELNQLVLFIQELRDQQLEIIFKKAKNEFVQKFFSKEDDVRNLAFLLPIISIDKRVIILKHLHELFALRYDPEKRNGETILHRAADNPECLDTILSLYPEVERLEAVKTKTQYGETILHRVAGKPECLDAILSQLPEHQRLEAVRTESQCGETVLHCAVGKPESLRMILMLYPEDERLEAVRTKTQYGETILHRIAGKPECLDAVLSQLPADQRLEAVRTKIQYGETILHRIAGKPECLDAVLSQLPADQRLEAVKAKSRYGQTVLHCAVDSPECLGAILSQLPEHQRLEAVKAKSQSGEAVLQHIIRRPECLCTVLPQLPEHQRLEVVIKKSQSGQTVLHHVADKLECLGTILSQLPEHQRLEAVMKKSRYGQTVLHCAVNSPECLGAILSRLPEHQRGFVA